MRLRQYFLRPSLDIDNISARLDFVSVFTHSDNQDSAQKLSKSMSRIKNMRTTMTLLRKGVNGVNQKLGGFKSGVWASLLEFCYHTIDVADSLNEVAGGESLPLRTRGLELLNKFELQRIGKMVHDVVDLELSIKQHRTVVKYGVDDNLDKIKEMYDGMDELLSKTVRQISASLAVPDVGLNVIYFPQLGFHITVPIDGATGDAVYSGGATPWERMFTTKNRVYFKDERMHDMDEQLGDLYAMICDREIEISYDLAQKVLLEEKLLVEVSDLCGEIDCLLALALGAIQYKLTRPRLTTENVIAIKGGRHILQEMTVPSYVPNDAYIVGGAGTGRGHSQTPGRESLSTAITPDGSPSPSMLLLTGPNYSGKSIYQKQVALVVYMAHIGSFVPAESARIGLTDKILTRITTRETVSKMQSAFMIDLQQIALAMNHCTRRSLVVIDEFGKGTDSCDGAGLAAGVLEHFLSLGLESPKVLAATHFHEIFDENFLKNDIALCHMEVRVDQNGKRRLGDHVSEVTYLYNLREGRSTLSYGTQCAAMNGIQAQIVSRASELADIVDRGEDLVAICAGVSPDEREELECAEACAREFLARDFAAGCNRDLIDVLDSVLAKAELR
jgi:DNA mismatch repair protein MSH5